MESEAIYSSTGTRGAHARRSRSSATPRSQLGQANLPPPSHPARARTQPPRTHFARHARQTSRESQRTRRRTDRPTAATIGQQHAHARRTARRTHRARPPRTAASSSAAELQKPRTNDDARRRKDAECPHEHKAGDADRWGTATLSRRSGNGEPVLFLPCERGSHRHTVVITRPRLSLAL